MRAPTLPTWLARILAGVVLTQAALNLARPVTSYRALALGADARAVGLITAAFAVAPLVVAVPLGRASDRWRPGHLLTGGIALGAVACLLLGTADGLWGWRWPAPCSGSAISPSPGLMIREPAVWLTEHGLPAGASAWQSAFKAANQRCRRHGVALACWPHKLRHFLCA